MEELTYNWENTVFNGVKIEKKRFNFELDFKFWAILPCLNINIHSLDLEFEWLCIGIYLNFGRKKIYINNPIATFWKEQRKIG